MIDCKITENFLKEKARMCGDKDCDDCEFDGRCLPNAICYIQENIDTVQKWGNEHTIKTYLSDFLEKYPKAKLLSTGIPYDVCVKRLYVETDCNNDCKTCWNTPIENER